MFFKVLVPNYQFFYIMNRKNRVENAAYHFCGSIIFTSYYYLLEEFTFQFSLPSLLRKVNDKVNVVQKGEK